VAVHDVVLPVAGNLAGTLFVRVALGRVGVALQRVAEDAMGAVVPLDKRHSAVEVDALAVHGQLEGPSSGNLHLHDVAPFAEAGDPHGSGHDVRVLVGVEAVNNNGAVGVDDRRVVAQPDARRPQHSRLSVARLARAVDEFGVDLDDVVADHGEHLAYLALEVVLLAVQALEVRVAASRHAGGRDLDDAGLAEGTTLPLSRSGASRVGGELGTRAR